MQSNRINGEGGTAAELYGGAGQGTHNGAVYQCGLDDQGGGCMETYTDTAPTLRAQAHNHPPIIYSDTVGTLAARDFKGVGNQYVQEGKLVVQDD